MKRYDPELKYIGNGSYVPIMLAAAEGEYVHAADIEQLIQKLLYIEADGEHFIAHNNAVAVLSKLVDVRESIPSTDEAWDDRTLGADEEFVKVAAIFKPLMTK